jgi:hypothetical protein
MPLPPLPDTAVIDGPGHISDSELITAYATQLAADNGIVINPIPAPAPDLAGHIAWHNAVVDATKTIAAALKVTVTLPATAVVGGLGHVTAHNQIVKALQDCAGKQAFTVTGGDIVEISGYRFHIFDKPGTSQLKVVGSGVVELLLLGSSGGSGPWPSTTPLDTYVTKYFIGGFGGAGGLLRIGDKLPTPTLNTGTYNVTVGRGGANSSSRMVPGDNGEDSSIIGPDLSLEAKGGGGGGTYDTDGLAGGTGGSGGCSVVSTYDDASSITTYSQQVLHNGGKGSQGGNGADAWENENGNVDRGFGGSCTTSATPRDKNNGPNGFKDGGKWDALAQARYQLGKGTPYKGWAHGEPTDDDKSGKPFIPGTPGYYQNASNNRLAGFGAVIICYPITGAS